MRRGGGRRRGRGWVSRRGVRDVSLGLLTANIGDAVNVFVAASVVSWFLRYPMVPALLPGLASLRGGIITSMAARVSTALHLGTLRPRVGEVLGAEAVRVLAVALISSVYVALAASAAAGLPWDRALVAAGVSSLASYAILAPAAALVAIGAYRRGVDPDRFVAPVLTVAGDMATIPTLLLGVAVAERLPGGCARAAALALAWAALALYAAVALWRPRDRRVAAESLPPLVLVGLLEAAAGGLMARWREALAAAGVLHVTPSFLEDTGAAAAIAASRLSTLLHLYGPARAPAYLAPTAAESLAGSLPSLAVLAVIGEAAASAFGISSGWTSAAVLAASWPVTVLLGCGAGYLIALASYRLGLDPDNVAVPLVTSLVDLAGTGVLGLTAHALSSL